MNDSSESTRLKEGRTKQLTQKHYGTGDNVARDKIENHTISPDAIYLTLTKILKQLRHRQFRAAKENLDTQNNTANLNTESKGIFEIIAVLSQLNEAGIQSEIYQGINDYLEFCNSNICRDIATSAQIRINQKEGRTKEAHAYYNSLLEPGVYTREAFYECIATHSDIVKAFAKQKTNSNEIDICGLARGALRLDQHEIALEISGYLQNRFPSFNSKVIHLVSTALHLHYKTKRNHYWCITSALRQELIDFANRIIGLLNDSNGEDKRVVNQAVLLSDFIVGSYKPLMDACWAVIPTIEELFPEHAAQIRYLYENRSDKLKGIPKKLAEAHKNSAVKNNTILEIINRQEISLEDSVLLAKVGDAVSIRQWINTGGEILATDGLEKAFLTLELKSLACDDDPKSIDDLRRLCTFFISKYRPEITQLNPHRLLDLADQLYQLNLCDHVCELIKPLLPDSDLWPSPIVRCYLGALLNSEQFMTLNTVLSDIHSDNWNDFLWQLKARQFEASEKYSEAIDATQKALNLNNNSIYNWHLLVGLYKKNGNDQVNIKKILTQIPESVFTQSSDLGYTLLHEMSVSGLFTRAEAISMRWFIENPQQQAVPFSNFCLNLFLCNEMDLNYASSVEQCLYGVIFLSDGKPNTKILFKSAMDDSNFIDAFSPLGKLLSDMSINDISQQGMSEITMINRLPPFITAFEIAKNLRLANNDGRDCFYSFDLPENPEEMLKHLEKKLSLPEDKSKELNANPDIPLFMKGYHQSKSCPVTGALKHLTDKASIKHTLPGFGEDHIKQVILDAYSIIYLALTGLIPALHSLPIQLIITSDSRHFLAKWLVDVNRDDYLTLGVNPKGGLWRTNAKEIQEQTLDIQKGINIVLANSLSIAPNMVDMPPDTLRIQDMIDVSVSSSLKLSIANEIPWLCIDQAFAYLLNASNVKTVNAQKFILSLTNSTDFEHKKQGIYRHVFTKLPYPLTYQEIAQLGMSTEITARFCLIEVFDQYPNLFKDAMSAIQFMVPVLQKVFINLITEKQLIQTLFENGAQNKKGIDRLFNACCRTAIHYPDTSTAEYYLALLLHGVLLELISLRSLNILIKKMALNFIDGHFLNLNEVNKNLALLAGKNNKTQTPT